MQWRAEDSVYSSRSSTPSLSASSSSFSSDDIRPSGRWRTHGRGSQAVEAHRLARVVRVVQSVEKNAKLDPVFRAAEGRWAELLQDGAGASAVCALLPRVSAAELTIVLGEIAPKLPQLALCPVAQPAVLSLLEAATTPFHQRQAAAALLPAAPRLLESSLGLSVISACVGQFDEHAAFIDAVISCSEFLRHSNAGLELLRLCFMRGSVCQCRRLAAIAGAGRPQVLA
eukprot:TRINITY_DN17770_c0_g1_i1.p1 TRINITY_DN17770_c0_g1~~TRINITY_DN17770_c0_g1_i1.p1  ORF type:complete len:242 (+),score=34.56 TRINITY_DN17770_c0_g1_i1:45-728(+)